MPVAPGRRDQRGEAIEQFEGRQDLADAPARSRLGALIDEVLRIDLPQPFLREGRAGAVAQQALPPLPVVPFDAHASVEREAAAVRAAALGFAIGRIEQAAPNEKADDPFAQRRLQSRQRLRAEVRLLETQTRGLLPKKHPIDRDDMEVKVGVHQRAKAVDEDDRADACRAVALRQALPQSLFDGAQKAVQHGALQFGVIEVVAQPFREREHPLPHRQGGKDVIDQMGGGFDHAPSGARRADASALAGVGDDEIVAAVGAAGTGKAVGEDAAVEVAAEFAFDERWG